MPEPIRAVENLIPTAKFLPTTRRLSFADWIPRAQIHIRGRAYSFKGHEYLRQIVHDPSPNQTFRKAAQVGISTVVMLKGMYVAEHLGKKCIYYFQDDQAVSDFSNDRVLPAIEQSNYLTERVGDVNNVGLKRIGPGSLYLRGLFSKGKAKSVDGDYLVLDEVTEMKDTHRALAMDRIMHSDLQWVAQLSQPGLPGEGIDSEFESTDQHFWHLECPGCGRYHCLEENFETNTNFLPIAEKLRGKFPEGATHYRGCNVCEAELDIDQGKWIPKRPDRQRRGYHLSQLYTSIKPPDFPNYASRVMSEFYESKTDQAKAARFRISILGYAYGGTAAQIDDDLLDYASGDYGFSYKEPAAFMGVDQGDILHIAVNIRSGMQAKFVWFEETQDWGRLHELMDLFKVQYCVIDALPNKWNAKDFAAKHRDRTSIQYFNAATFLTGKELHENKWEVNKVDLDRTEAIDDFISKIQAGLVVIPKKSHCSDANLARLEEVRRQLKKLVWKYEEGRHGLMRRVYIHGPNVDNHFGMAMNSACIAAFKLGRVPGPTVLPIWGKMGRA